MQTFKVLFYAILSNIIKLLLRIIPSFAFFVTLIRILQCYNNSSVHLAGMQMFQTQQQILLVNYNNNNAI